MSVFLFCGLSYLCFWFGFNLFGGEQQKPIVRPRTVIIYPPTTAAEFLERREKLKEAMNDPKGAHIVVKEKNEQSKK